MQLYFVFVRTRRVEINTQCFVSKVSKRILMKLYIYSLDEMLLNYISGALAKIAKKLLLAKFTCPSFLM